MAEAIVELPTLDEAPRCSPWSREQAIAPAGTAIRADQILLLDAPAPWPKTIRDHPRLLGMMDVAGEARVPTRLLASMPVDDRIRLTMFRNVDGRGARSTYIIPDVGTVPAAIAAIAAEDPGVDELRVEDPAVRRSLLVCTQGTHDVCCGSDGGRLAAAAEQRLEGVDVYRISHTGGHRFAPTAMTFPDGRMWAWVTVDDIEGIMARRGDHADLASRCRGWWGAEKGPQQVAEAAVFAATGWEIEGLPRTVTGTDGVIVVAGPTGRHHVAVEPGRTVPTISCRTPGGRPWKTATEYRARLL